ncbi:MAG TPA: hypothetical protein VGS59_14605 [Candidatus Acidoferrales bacterium]|nr:hypothetical protein [Candidatus Acidoferrales bacterium]
MKTLVALCFVAALATPAFAGPREYQSGKIVAFDTGQQRAKNVKHGPKDEVVYQVQIAGTIYKVTNHTKKQDFSAGEEVQCRVEKTHLIIEKLKGGEVKYEILGESAQTERSPGATP